MFHRLGEVTLRDFKSTLDRPGQFRYHFKALDPEFGTVKEEVRILSFTRKNSSYRFLKWSDANLALQLSNTTRDLKFKN